MPGEAGVDAVARPPRPRRSSWPRRGDRFSWAWMPISVVGLEHVAIGADALAHAVHRQRAAGVGDVDAVRAVGLHQLGLLGERSRRLPCGSSSGSRRRPCRARGRARCAGRRCRPRCSAWRRGRCATPSVVGGLELVRWCRCRAAAAWSSFACLTTLGRGLDPLPVGVGAEAVVEAAARQAVAVGDLDASRPRPRRGRAAICSTCSTEYGGGWRACRRAG